MKPLTNETLIEFEKKLEDYSNGVYYDGDPKRYEGTEKKDLIDFIASALQAKEEDMVEKFKEMIGEDEKIDYSYQNVPEEWRADPDNVDMETRNNMRATLRSKLSNLSEK